MSAKKREDNAANTSASTNVKEGASQPETGADHRAKGKTPRTLDERILTMLSMLRGLSGSLYAEEGGERADIVARHYRSIKAELDAVKQPSLPNT